uniref:Uncharacterized protein n=1 Tax=Romanomermis culicivorax TaxID=13658 RepID=A0A915HR61_ROMCU
MFKAASKQMLNNPRLLALFNQLHHHGQRPKQTSPVVPLILIDIRKVRTMENKSVQLIFTNESSKITV